MTLTHLETAIAELAAAKRTAEFFKQPREIIERIDLVKRATAKLKAQMQEARKTT